MLRKTLLFSTVFLFLLSLLYQQGCSGIDEEPPPPSDSFIIAMHLEMSNGIIYKTERDGNSITYYGVEHRPVRAQKYTFEVIPTRSTQYIIVYELVDGQWIHVSTKTH